MATALCGELLVGFIGLFVSVFPTFLFSRLLWQPAKCSYGDIHHCWFESLHPTEIEGGELPIT